MMQSPMSSGVGLTDHLQTKCKFHDSSSKVFRRSSADKTKIDTGWAINLKLDCLLPRMLKRLSISVLLMGVSVILGSIPNRAGAQTPPELPRLLIIATGGTIAGDRHQSGRPYQFAFRRSSRCRPRFAGQGCAGGDARSHHLGS